MVKIASNGMQATVNESRLNMQEPEGLRIEIPRYNEGNEARRDNVAPNALAEAVS